MEKLAKTKTKTNVKTDAKTSTMIPPIIQHPFTTFAGAKLIYLPHTHQPIKQMFHLIKAWLRQHEAEAVWLELRPWLIHQAVESVSAESAEGWILNCGYSF